MKQLKLNFTIGIMFMLCFMGAHAAGQEQELTFNPPVPSLTIDLPEPRRPVAAHAATDYKTLRLREMADTWVGTVLEPHTVKLLSMLIQEDGTVTAERRHDCQPNGNCWSIGIQGHHICHRGTPIVSQRAGKPFRTFCYWADLDGDGKFESSPQEQFEKEYPGFSKDWRIQFAEYTVRMTDCINAGKTVNACIQAWNSREEGRIAKVERHMPFVKKAIDL